jgi:hypothetical protein
MIMGHECERGMREGGQQEEERKGYREVKRKCANGICSKTA